MDPQDVGALHCKRPDAFQRLAAPHAAAMQSVSRASASVMIVDGFLKDRVVRQQYLFSGRGIQELHDLVLDRARPVGLWQIPANEHADQQRYKCTHVCIPREALINLQNHCIDV